MTLNPANIRILHIITALSTGGAEMMLLKLLSATRERYTQAVVSLKNEGTIGPRIKELGVPLHTLGLRPAVPNPFRVLAVRSLIREFRPDLIQGWMYHGNVMASLSSAFSRSHAPVVWNVQQSVREVADYGRMTAMVIRVGSLMSKSPAKIIYVSHIGAKQHEALGYDAERGVVIANGIDCVAFRPDDEARHSVRAELGVSPESVLVGLIARYHPMKDHGGFLIAAAQVLRSHPSVHFMLVGRGVSKEEVTLSKTIAEHHLQDRVFLLGERRDVARLTAALDIACSASAWGEAFSNAIGEAMACGVPCVVTDVGDSAHIVGETGLVVPPGDSARLAQAITQLIETWPERRQLGLAARQRVQTEFSLPSVADQYEQLYEGLVLPRMAAKQI